MGIRITPAEYARWQRIGLIPSDPLPVILTPALASQPARVPLPPKMSEAQFQDYVIRYAQSRGFKVAHFRRVKVQRKDGSIHHETPVAADGKGWPDLFMARGKRGLAWELKVPPNKPTPEQEAWLRVLGAAGLEVGVYYPRHWQEIMDLLD